MQTTRLVFKLIGALWAVAIVVIGLGGTWLERHPETAAAYGLKRADTGGHASLGERLGSALAGHYDDRNGEERFRDLRRQHEAEQRDREMRQAGWTEEAVSRSAAPMTDLDGANGSDSGE